MKDPYPLGHALTQLYLSQEQSRGQEEASAMEAMHRAEEADSSFERERRRFTLPHGESCCPSVGSFLLCTWPQQQSS